MLNSTNQRLNFFVKSKHLKVSEFAIEIGTSQPTMSLILAGKRPLSRGMIARIKAHYPQLNVQWLLTGEGDMVVNSNSGGVSNFADRNGRIYNNSYVLEESAGEVEETIVEFNENTEPKELVREIHRLKALLFDRDEKIKILEEKLSQSKKK